MTSQPDQDQSPQWVLTDDGEPPKHLLEEWGDDEPAEKLPADDPQPAPANAAPPIKDTSRMWVKCQPCGNVWAALQLPMEMTKAARCLKRIYCPRCGETKKIFMALEADVAEVI